MTALVTEGAEICFWTLTNPRRPERDIGMGCVLMGGGILGWGYWESFVRAITIS